MLATRNGRDFHWSVDVSTVRGARGSSGQSRSLTTYLTPHYCNDREYVPFLIVQPPQVNVVFGDMSNLDTRPIHPDEINIKLLSAMAHL
jgi:hypothetical protein